MSWDLRATIQLAGRNPAKPGAYLNELSVNGLKIDQIFVLGIIDNTDDLAIIKGVIGLGAAFRREVIA